MIPKLRAGVLLATFFAMTLPLMPVQAALLRMGRRGRNPPARHFPNWYHRRLCRLLGIRLHVEGTLTAGAPTLLLANHVSWLDIPVLSAMAPVSFVAKSEVDTWPMVRTLARLQRTVFVDRKRRLAVGGTASEIASRLADGDAIVLFAEGTSNDGNRVLPFRSALIGAVGADQRRRNAVRPSESNDSESIEPEPVAEVRTVAIAYTHLHGIPLDRFQRPGIAWYGDMELGGHVWELLGTGPIDVYIRIGEAVSLSSFRDRKTLTLHAENVIRRDVALLLRQAGHEASRDG